MSPSWQTAHMAVVVGSKLVTCQALWLLLRDRLHRHTWGSWAPLRNINYYDDGATRPTHRTTVLVRTCSTCGDSRSKEMRI